MAVSIEWVSVLSGDELAEGTYLAFVGGASAVWATPAGYGVAVHYGIGTDYRYPPSSYAPTQMRVYLRTVGLWRESPPAIDVTVSAGGHSASGTGVGAHELVRPRRPLPIDAPYVWPKVVIPLVADDLDGLFAALYEGWNGDGEEGDLAVSMSGYDGDVVLTDVALVVDLPVLASPREGEDGANFFAVAE